MSSTNPNTDLGSEREIDLGRIWDAVKARWWIALVGLVVGVIIGAVYSVSGATTYTASALIAPGQAFSPSGGTTVLTYLTNQAAIDALAKSPTTVAAAAAKAGMNVGALDGHISTSTTNQGTGTSATRTIQITVRSNRPKRAEDAANAIAAIIKDSTTSDYVKQSIKIYGVRLRNYAARLRTLGLRIQALNTALAQSQDLKPLDRLVLVSELDQAEASQGSTLASQTLTQQDLVLANDVSRTQILQQATAQKSTGRSRRTSVLVGGLIGLLVGILIAAVLALRAPKPATA